MSMEGIIDRIKKDAASQAEKIRRQYADTVKKAEHDFEHDRSEALDAATARAKIERKREHDRTLEHAKSLESRRLLAHKHRVIDNFYSSVRAELEALSPDATRKLFARLLANVELSNGYIIAAKDAELFDATFFKQAADAASPRKLDFSVRVTEGSFRGFFVESGKIRFDLTFDAIMELLRDKTQEMIIAELFD